MRLLIVGLLIGLGCIAAGVAIRAGISPASAASPVLLGDQTVESFSDSSDAPASEVFGYTASLSGTASSASVYLTSTDGVTVGLYSDSSSHHPATLIVKGSVSSNATGWTVVPLVATVVSGRRYWLAIGANAGGQITYRDRNRSGSNLDFSGTGFASPYTSNGQWSSNPASVYVTGGSTTTSSTSTTTTSSTTSSAPTPLTPPIVTN